MVFPYPILTMDDLHPADRGVCGSAFEKGIGRRHQMDRGFILLHTLCALDILVWYYFSAMGTGMLFNISSADAGIHLRLSPSRCPGFRRSISITIMGADGLSVPMLFLTGLLSFISIIASFGIKDRVKEYFAWFLLLETGMMGTFSALDFFLFYIFWEIMLVPMYFLIGIWGGPRREYAAIKFFLYTLFGSVFMLIAYPGALFHNRIA